MQGRHEVEAVPIATNIAVHGRFLGGPPVACGGNSLPVVLRREEVKDVLAQLRGDKWLMAALLYGSGLRRSSGDATLLPAILAAAAEPAPAPSAAELEADGARLGIDPLFVRGISEAI